MNGEVILEFVKQLGVLAILAWFLYYTVRYMIPGLLKEHAAVINKIVAEHRETIDTITERFDNRLKEERVAWQEDLAAEREHRQREIAQLTEAIDRIVHK